VRWEFRFEHEQTYCQRQQHQSGEVYRQQMHRVQGQNQRDPANYARREQTGMGKFGVQPQNADDQQNEKHIGLYQPGKKSLPRRHFKILNTGLRQFECYPGAIKPGDGAAVELLQQRSGRWRHHVDQLAVESFLLAEGLRVGHRGGRQVHVPSAAGNVATQVRGRFV
jgi:hypothetical protein